MDDRFLQESGLQVYSGTELLLKGALESGVGLLTGYPGSPLADFFDAARSAKELLLEKGIVFEMANNEALAAARLNGSQMSDIRALAVMKSVGAHVASDSLSLGNLAKASHNGGALVVIGDDPWSDSTQVPADSRFLCAHLHLPVLEPSTFQELKDWVRYGFEFSAASSLFLAYLVTTNQADGGGTVEVFPNQYPKINQHQRATLDTSTLPLEQTVLLPPRTGRREEDLPLRFRMLLEAVRIAGLNRIVYPSAKRQPLGFISSGLAYCYLQQALDELGMCAQVPILKLGLTYPLDAELLRQFADMADELFVVEEKRGFLEAQVTQTLKELYQTGRLDRFPKVWGKAFPDGLEGFPETRGLNTSIVEAQLIPLFQRMPKNGWLIDLQRLEQEQRLIDLTAKTRVQIPVRTPTFCPGCPHRDSSSVLLEIKRDFQDPSYMRRVHRRGPVDLVFHGDTGCYTMLMFEPNAALMHNYSGMGLGGGTGAGINRFITNKQAVFMGDSTFFHSGMIAISDSIKHGQDIAYVILDNKTTAMTGHQPTAGNEQDIFGQWTVAQDIEEVVRGMAKSTSIDVVRVNPAYHRTYRRTLEEALLKDGVKVVIADKECGITFHRRKRAERFKTVKERGFLPQERHINITPEVCEFCLECTRVTGCPGLTTVDTPYGTKIATDLSTCVTDGACTQVLACPSFEEVVIHRTEAPPTVEAVPVEVDQLPEPARRPFAGRWSAYLAGVGGMGVGTMTAILVRAGMREGFRIRFSERKGLAIRNGGVFSHVIYTEQTEAYAPIIPYGKADLLLGIDLLEAVRGIDPEIHFRVASPAYTAAVVNTTKTPTITTLIGKEDFDPRQLEEYLREVMRPGAYFGADLAELSEHCLGSDLYANLMLLGAAYQNGWLPVSKQSLLWAIGATLRKDELAKNLQAFALGRQLIANPAAFANLHRVETSEELLHQRHEWLAAEGRRGRWLAASYERLVRRSLAAMPMLDAPARCDFVRRVYDLMRYEDLAYAKSYADRVRATYARDRATHGWAATKAVIWYLFKMMAIKDEVYVAYLLTSPEKLERDRQRYQVDQARGDVMQYRHFNRPSFPLFGREIEFGWRSKHWQLRLMSRAKFLRRLLRRWHERERSFRDWYYQLVDGLTYDDARGYELYLQVLRAPEMVRGYRKVRYPTMIEAQRRVEQWLREAQLPVPKLPRSIAVASPVHTETVSP